MNYRQLNLVEEKMGGSMVKQADGAKKVNNEKKRFSFLKLLLFILVPLLTTTAVLLVIAKNADINVFDKAKEWTSKLPFVEEREKKEEIVDNKEFEERIVTLQAEIKEKEALVFQLEDKLQKAKEESESLRIDQEKLQDEIALLQRESEESKRNFNEIITTFEKMSPKASAPVIVKMNDAEALQILSKLKPDTLAAILEKMSPEDAAKYTSLMTK